MIISILKIIGIILLVILLLLIFILSVLLFVPIRYQFKGSYDEKADVNISVKWMPVFLNALLTYKEDNLFYIVKLYGGVIVTNQDIPLSWIGKKIRTASDDKLKDNQTVTKDVSGTEVTHLQEEVSKIPEKTITQTKKDVKKHKKKQPFFLRMKNKIQSFIEKIKIWIEKIKKINEKKDALLKVYHHKRFEVAKNDVIRYIKELWRGIKPKKLEGRIHFGLEDPATTGQILGVLSMFLVWYYEHIRIEPDFEKACFDGELSFHGKIRLFTLFKIIIKIIFNKNLIKVVKKVQTIIES